MLSISSPSFAHETEIPSRFTCEGEDVSPELKWSNVPAEAKSLVLIVDDPDAPDPRAPQRVWVHWVLYNLPTDSAGLAEAVAKADLPKGTREGRNDWGRAGWGGPCPPIGRHRYFFKLYALKSVLPDLGLAKKAQIEEQMTGQVIERAELMGTYQKRS
jgi:Raf kinase inhibitor-like YbhB/YbcL family protein